MTTGSGSEISWTEARDQMIRVAERHEEELERAYRLGILHGINAQSMAQVENDVMSFDDYGWEI